MAQGNYLLCVRQQFTKHSSHSLSKYPVCPCYNRHDLNVWNSIRPEFCWRFNLSVLILVWRSVYSITKSLPKTALISRTWTDASGADYSVHTWKHGFARSDPVTTPFPTDPYHRTFLCCSFPYQAHKHRLECFSRNGWLPVISRESILCWLAWSKFDHPGAPNSLLNKLFRESR